MTNIDGWLLPDGIDDVLPEQAQLVESARRKLLDLYASWGYDLVIPPMVEFTESLLSGSGADLDLMTFRVTDQISGRMMGIRADITPQTARMDAHSLSRVGPSRLCYAGTVLQTRPRGPLESRTPISLGVELFGESSLQADIEVIELFLKTLEVAEVSSVHLDLGHVNIFRGLLANANLSSDQEAKLFELLQRKAVAEINVWVEENITEPKLKEWLNLLPTLSGDSSVLQKAKSALSGAPDSVINALDQLEQIIAVLSDKNIAIYLDLGELPGFHYHTGVVFAAYVPGHGKALGNGGRYDHVGESFGRSRPATGFAFDLKSLVDKGQLEPQTTMGIFVSADLYNECPTLVAELREQGQRVVQGFAGQVVDFQEINCDRQVVRQGEEYLVKKLP